MKKKREQEVVLSPQEMTGEERLAIWHRAQETLGKKANAMLRHMEKGRQEWEERMKELEKIWRQKK